MKNPFYGIGRTGLLGKAPKETKNGKTLLLEKLLSSYKLPQDFNIIISRLKYSNPNSLINLLKKNPEIMDEEALERTIMDYGTCVSGQGDKNKMERFKLLLKYYSLTEDYGTIMEKLNYSKSANFQNFIYFALSDRFDEIKKNYAKNESLVKILNETFRDFNLESEAKGLQKLTGISAEKIIKENYNQTIPKDNSLNFQFFLNQLNYAQNYRYMPYSNKAREPETGNKDAKFIEVLSEPAKELDFKKIMRLAGYKHEWSFEKLLKRTALNYPEKKETITLMLQQYNKETKKSII